MLLAFFEFYFFKREERDMHVEGIRLTLEEDHQDQEEKLYIPCNCLSMIRVLVYGTTISKNNFILLVDLLYFFI
jgi:hypothetical protein